MTKDCRSVSLLLSSSPEREDVLNMADVVEAVVVAVTAFFSVAAAVMLLGIASGEEAALGAAEEGEASVLASANS